MVQSFRQREILDIVQKQGKVTVDGLSKSFNVTVQTIRKDLNELCDSGVLRRVHGGAIMASGIENIGYEERRALASEAKDAIAQICVQHIPNGASLFLNIGTSTEAVARALLKHKNLMVITNNLNVANILGNGSDFEVIVAGGILRRADGGLVGEVTADFMRQFKVDYAVIGTSALDEDGDLLDFDFREVKVSQAIIHNARKAFLVSDHSKFERTAPVKIVSLTELDMFFTDQQPSAVVCQLCDAANVIIETT
ncbi:MAG: DeoR/GlpR transcriptional regulator [Alphaproteobacteria bacterium]|nr:DeoR/GlpR transcriptional regulator [Alphaproteobacteria bacterium]